MKLVKENLTRSECSIESVEGIGERIGEKREGKESGDKMNGYMENDGKGERVENREEVCETSSVEVLHENADSAFGLVPETIVHLHEPFLLRLLLLLGQILPMNQRLFQILPVFEILNDMLLDDIDGEARHVQQPPTVFLPLLIKFEVVQSHHLLQLHSAPEQVSPRSLSLSLLLLLLLLSLWLLPSLQALLL